MISSLLLTTACRQPFHRAELALNEGGFYLMALLDLLLAPADCTKHLRTEFTIALALLSNFSPCRTFSASLRSGALSYRNVFSLEEQILFLEPKQKSCHEGSTHNKERTGY